MSLLGDWTTPTFRWWYRWEHPLATKTTSIGSDGRAVRDRPANVCWSCCPLKKKRTRSADRGGRRKKSGKGSYSNLREDPGLAHCLGTQSEFSSENENEKTESLYQRCQDDLEATRLKVRSGHVVLTPGAEAAYKTFLAHYTATVAPPHRKKKGGNNQTKTSSKNNALSPSRILAYAGDFAEGTGLASVPELDDEFVSKLGLDKQ
mmetsp:Transcript_113646/g.232504  ORF Transcript_113646/g.232504 Transcript_113646/m.232504 type:complete len:205 (+) Transcript_113646:270-884(+)